MDNPEESEESTEQRSWKITLGLILLIVLSLGVVASTVYWEATSGTQFTTTEGPDIYLTEDHGLTSQNPFPNNETVDFGNVSIQSENRTYMNASGLDSTFTVLGNISGDADYINITHTDKNDIWINETISTNNNVSTVEKVEWREIELNATDPDIKVNGSGSIRVEDLQSSTTFKVERSNLSNLLLSTGASDSIEFNVSDDDVNILEAGSQTLSNPYPTNNQPVNGPTVDLQVRVDHPDFDAGETVTLDWFVNQNLESTTATSSAGLQSITASATNITRGANNWSVVATDSKNVQAVINGSFATPTNLTIRDEQNPKELVNSTSVNITFFGEDGSIISNQTSTGRLDMKGLPLDTRWTVQAEANGFITRQTYVDRIVEPTTIWLLNSSAPTVETTFTISDPTGEFNPTNTRVLVKKPIERNGDTSYETVVGDIAGFGGFSTTLEQDQRYILEVVNTESGAQRQMGPYVARTSEVVELSIDDLNFNFSDSDNEVPYDLQAEFVNETGPAVDFAFGAEEKIDKLNVKVTQRNNKSVEVMNETFRNRDNPVSVRRVIPNEVEDPDAKTYEVEWSGSIDGKEVGGSQVVGGDLAISPAGMPQQILSIVGVFLIFVVGGLFSAANATVGAIVVALLAGALWIVGVVPNAVSGMFIVVALTVAIMYHIRRGPNPPR